MHHQVAHLQVGVAEEPLAAVGLGLAGLFGLAGQCAGQLPLGEHRQLQRRPLAAGGQGAHGDEHLPRRRGSVALQRQRGGDVPVLQQLLHIAAAHRAAAQHQHAEAGGQIVGDVGGGGVQTAAVARQLLGPHIQQQPGREQIPAGGQALQLAQGEAGEHGLQLRFVQGQVAEGPGHDAALHGGGHVLPGLEQEPPQGLLHTPGLADADDGVRGQVVEGGGLVRVDGGHIAVAAGGRHPLPQQFRVVQQALAGGGVLLFQAAGGVLHAAGGLLRRALTGKGKQLGGGQDAHLAAVQHPPLGGHLELAHAVQLVVEELAAEGALLTGGEHVQYAAPQGELTGALHLVGTGVPGGGKTAAEGADVVLSAHLQREGHVQQHIPWQAALGHGGGGGHHHGRVAPGHAVQGGQAAVFPLAAVGRRAQLQLPLRQAHRLRVQQHPQVRRLASALLLVGAQEQQRALCLRRHGGGEHGPVYGGQPRDGGAAVAAGDGRGELTQLRQGQKFLQQPGHRASSFHVFRDDPRSFKICTLKCPDTFKVFFKKIPHSIVAVHRFFRAVFH